MELTEVIKIIRKELNVTQEQLAQELNISFSTVSRWENGKTGLSKLAKLRLEEYCKSKDIDSAIIGYIKKK